MRAQHEVADALRAHWPRVEKHPQINSWQLRTLGAPARWPAHRGPGRPPGDACHRLWALTRPSAITVAATATAPNARGKNREDWDPKAGGRAIARAVLSCGVHPALEAEPAGHAPPARGVQLSF
ncbi:MAG: hypothetical protein U5L96_17895 [Owenweeksia sp.]|nr:hypothetical protein [Owenweeksia sp.]